MRHVVSPLRRALAIAASGALVSAAGLACMTAATANAPGNPGVPSAPTPIYTEDFENGTGTAPVKLDAYTGASGMTYTAAIQWLSACNGAVVSQAGDTGPAAATAAGCGAESNYNNVRVLAQAIGNLNNPGTAEANHAVTAYTEANPGADRIQFKTNAPISLSTSDRFIAFSVDAAESNCQSNHARLKFYLLDGTTEVPTFTTPIDPCGSSTTVPPVAGHYTSDKAVLFSGSQVGIVMRNGQGLGAGNDAAFDNVSMVDATPQLDAKFGPDTVAPDEQTVLTFTITNTSELGAKEGWSFSGPLPPGLEPVIGEPSVNGCGGTFDFSGGTFTATGNLAAGETSCILTIPLKGTDPGTYTIDPDDIDVAGLDLPDPATLTIAAVVDVPIFDPAVSLGAVLVTGMAAAAVAIHRRRNAA